MRKLICLKSILVTLLLPFSVHSEVLWQDFSVSYTYGQDFRVGDPDRQIITLEHAAGTNWGDSFMFLDHLRSDNGDRDNYAEWSPRLSLCKAGISCISNSWIKDVLVASTLEMSTVSTDILLGMGADLDIRGFTFLQVNVYRRQNDNVSNNWQITSAWSRPFKFGNHSFIYDGFIDWYNTTKDQNSSLNWTSQLKWSASDWLGLSSQLYFGVEYVFWRNKFGIADSPALRTNESNINALVKWHF
ncbi:nucleoside-binding protein [Alteromonadaceae bacterium BrNp21-10]|nr:nucleoside-binding protein [Alteromonadaceae bacterium BrNp21-10]